MQIVCKKSTAMLLFSFELDKRSARKNGTFPLKTKIYRSRTDYVIFGVKIYLRPEQWDENKERIVNSVTATTDNARLNNYRVAIGKALLDIDESGENPAMQEIRARVQVALGQKQPKPKTFYAYAEEYADKINQKGTRAGFGQTIKKMRQFDSIDRSFPEITVGWLRNFQMHEINRGLSTNGLFMHLRNIRTIYNRAIDDGVAQLNDYPFRRFRIKQEKTRKRALSVEQLRELRDFPCSESQTMYRDVFMLIFYLAGINIGDLFKLQI